MNPPTPEQTGHLWEMMKLPAHWPMQTDLLQWCQTMSPGSATVLVMGGMVYLLFGWYIFRALMMLNSAVLGAYLGGRVGQHGGSMLAGACVGAFVSAAMTWPLMKYAVAFMG